MSHPHGRHEGDVIQCTNVRNEVTRSNLLDPSIHFAMFVHEHKTGEACMGQHILRLTPAMLARSVVISPRYPLHDVLLLLSASSIHFTHGASRCHSEHESTASAGSPSCPHTILPLRSLNRQHVPHRRSEDGILSSFECGILSSSHSAQRVDARQRIPLFATIAMASERALSFDTQHEDLFNDIERTRRNGMKDMCLRLEG
jgi:hypothetical protein